MDVPHMPWEAARMSWRRTVREYGGSSEEWRVESDVYTGSQAVEDVRVPRDTRGRQSRKYHQLRHNNTGGRV